MYHFPMGMGTGPFPAGDTGNVNRTLEHIRRYDIETAEQLLPWVGYEVPRDDLRSLIMYARDERWQALAAQTLLLFEDTTAAELECIIRFLNDPPKFNWRQVPQSIRGAFKYVRRQRQFQAIDFSAIRRRAWERLVADPEIPLSVFERIAGGRTTPEPWCSEAARELRRRRDN